MKCEHLCKFVVLSFFVILMSCLMSYSARDNVIGLQHELFLAPGLFQLKLYWILLLLFSLSTFEIFH